MSVAQTLFGFSGRLRRRDWWLFGAAVTILEWLAVNIASSGVGGPAGWELWERIGTDPTARHLLAQDLRFQGVVAAIFLWPSLALSVKRLHDRGCSGWWLALPYAFLGAQALIFYLRFSGLGGGGGGPHFAPALDTALDIGFVFSAIGLFIEMAILDGTHGPNSFGPSPKSEAHALLTQS
jgi:uncharacterized membrane protein YhaH (DUF805 family)